MRTILFILLPLFLISCTSKDGKHNLAEPLFNDQVFNIYDGEIITPITLPSRKMHEKYFNNTNIQIPLFKYIKHEKYDVFIGVPLSTSINEIGKSVLEKHDSTFGYQQSSKNFCYNQYNKKGMYLTEFAIQVDNKSLIFIASITQSKKIADSLFISSKLQRRISRGEN